MKARGVVAALAVTAALALAGCHQPEAPQSQGNRTAVLGGNGPGATQLTDARGEPIPQPPVPANTPAQTVRTGEDAALSVWAQDGHIMASSWHAQGGWTKPQALETIYGQASDPELASNGQGIAMAVWRHTVGNIRSLRFSRFDAKSGWSAPDVVPGALPRPDTPRVPPDDAPRLQMDAQGNVAAQWPSGFEPNEMQQARYVAGQGWTAPVSERLASTPNASPGSRDPSSAR
jgi:hypothetical protein